MIRSSLIAASSVILCATASAQHTTKTMHKTGNVKNAGIYHVATGTWTRNVSQTANLGPDTIYTNTIGAGYFTTLGLETSTGDTQLIDSGRIPTTGGSIPTADRVDYELNGIVFSYCTEVSTPTVEINFTLFESYLPCDLPSLANPTIMEAGTAGGTGLPGGGAPGANACWLITFDLEGMGDFCLEGDGGALAPGFNNDVTLDSFGISWEFTGSFGTLTGPIIAGDPDWTPVDPGSILGVGGSGTYYFTGTGFCGDTGLDTQDFIAVDGATSLPMGPNCYFFGGYKNTNGCGNAQIPFASLNTTLIAAADECDLPPPGPTFCEPAGVNSSGNAAAIAVTTTGTLGGTSAGIRLDATGGPDVFGSAFGFFLVSDGTNANITLGQGTLCLDGPQGRYSPTAGGIRNSLGLFDSNGDFESLTGNTTTGFGFDVPTLLPSPPGGSITTGSTWHFQLWYRDIDNSTSPPLPTVNLTNGISVTF